MQQLTRWRFTVHDYHRMGEAGILHEDDRVELIQGELVQMTAIGTRHFSCVNRLNRLMVLNFGDEAIVSVQNPVRLNEYNEPQPDVTVIRTRDYRESLPMPEDVLLLIEVSDTTLAYDRGIKLPLYARAGIGEVWIVNLPGEIIERHTGPPTATGTPIRRAAGRRWNPPRYRDWSRAWTKFSADLGCAVYGAPENGQALLQFLVGDDEGHQGADAVAVLAGDEEQEPFLEGGFDHLPRSLLVGGTAFGVSDELHGGHGASAAHVSDEVGVAVLDLTHRGHDTLAKDVCTREEVFLLECFEHGEGGGAGYGVASVGGAEAPDVDGVHDLRLPRNAGYGEPTAHALGRGNDVRLDP